MSNPSGSISKQTYCQMKIVCWYTVCFTAQPKILWRKTALRVPAQQTGPHQKAHRWLRPAEGAVLAVGHGTKQTPRPIGALLSRSTIFWGVWGSNSSLFILFTDSPLACFPYLAFFITLFLLFSLVHPFPYLLFFILFIFEGLFESKKGQQRKMKHFWMQKEKLRNAKPWALQRIFLQAFCTGVIEPVHVKKWP